MLCRLKQSWDSKPCMFKGITIGHYQIALGPYQPREITKLPFLTPSKLLLPSLFFLHSIILISFFPSLHSCSPYWKWACFNLTQSGQRCYVNSSSLETLNHECLRPLLLAPTKLLLVPTSQEKLVNYPSPPNPNYSLLSFSFFIQSFSSSSFPLFTHY